MGKWRDFFRLAECWLSVGGVAPKIGHKKRPRSGDRGLSYLKL